MRIHIKLLDVYILNYVENMDVKNQQDKKPLSARGHNNDQSKIWIDNQLVIDLKSFHSNPDMMIIDKRDETSYSISFNNQFVSISYVENENVENMIYLLIWLVSYTNIRQK